MPDESRTRIEIGAKSRSMISGLVVHLTGDKALRDAAIHAMQRRSGLELGEQSGRRLPVVLESDGKKVAEDTTEWLKELPGVAHVDVTFVHLEE